MTRGASFEPDSYRGRADAYARGVLAGTIPAGHYVRLACKRFRADLQRKDIALTDDAERWCRFVERLRHVKGQWAGELFTLSEWQVFCTAQIYGWRRTESGRRRFREAYIEVPRKNGKTLWVAALGIGHLTIDGESGAEVYCGATSEQQAWEVFRPAKLMCERDMGLRDALGLEVHAKALSVVKTGSRFNPVIGNPGDGASPSCAIVDEFHEHKTSDLVDTFRTGMGARQQPMLLQITTAGSDMGGPCYEKRSDVIHILEGSVEDDSIFGVVYTLDEGDPWDTVEAQQKANPNYGVSVDGEFLAGQLSQARRSSVTQTAYKTKHLNLWVGAKSAWMNMLAYQRCRNKHLTRADFRGQPCIVGIDLASKIDIASMAILFPPSGNRTKYAAFVRHYLPEDAVLEGGNTRYKAWHADGWLTTTPGNVTDYSYIEDDLKALKSEHQILEVPYDPFQATQFATRMMEEGFPMVEVGATVRNFSEPMKSMEALIMQQHIEFEPDPVLMWMFGNVTAQLDRKDNIFPNKERPDAKIDGVVALIMALNRLLARGPERDSIYEQRGLLVV